MVAGPARRPGLGGAGEELRRVAPNAALMALGAASPGRPGTTWSGRTSGSRRCWRGCSGAGSRSPPPTTARALGDAGSAHRPDEPAGARAGPVRESSDRERGQGPLAALLVDCDDFKRINDDSACHRRRRAAAGGRGPAATRPLAATRVARVGGDEFLVLLPNTRTWEAVEVAERIRNRSGTRWRSGTAGPDGLDRGPPHGRRLLLGRRAGRRHRAGPAGQQGGRQGPGPGGPARRVGDGAGARRGAPERHLAPSRGPPVHLPHPRRNRPRDRAARAHNCRERPANGRRADGGRPAGEPLRLGPDLVQGGARGGTVLPAPAPGADLPGHPARGVAGPAARHDPRRA